jgi:hypothetical protein
LNYLAPHGAASVLVFQELFMTTLFAALSEPVLMVVVGASLVAVARSLRPASLA